MSAFEIEDIDDEAPPSVEKKRAAEGALRPVARAEKTLREPCGASRVAAGAEISRGGRKKITLPMMYGVGGWPR